MRWCAHPLAQIPSVRERHSARNNTGLHLRLCRDIPCTRDDDLVRWTDLATNKLHFICDEKADCLHVLPLPPSPRQDIPLETRYQYQYSAEKMVMTYLGRCANNQVALLEQPKVCTRLARQAHDLLSTLQVAKLLAPFLDPLVNHLLVRLDTHCALLLALAPESKEGKLRADRLPTAGRRADEDVIVGGVQRLEDLGLYLVERLNGGRVYTLKLLVMQGGERKSLEIEEWSGRREFLGEDEVLEGDREAGLGLQPAIRHDGNVVVRWDRLEHRHSESDVVLVLGVPLTKNEGVVEEDDLTIDILHQDPERLGPTMDLLVPTEVGNDGQVYPKESTSDRLNLCLQPSELSTRLRRGYIGDTHCSLGKLCTRRCTNLPAFWMPMSSPISGGF